MTRLILGLLLWCACGDNRTAIDPRPLPSPDHGRTRLRWKRFRVVQNDLARALALPLEDVCKESSGEPCATGGPVTLLDWLRNEGVEEAKLEEECMRIQQSSACVDGPYIPFDNPRGVHVIALGGNNAMLRGVFEGIKEPIVTSPITLERYVLTACGERAARDHAGPARVFTRLALDEPVSSTTTGVTETIVDLYRALLGRDPRSGEVAAMGSILDDGPLRGDVFARLVCFAIATSKEFTYQ